MSIKHNSSLPVSSHGPWALAPRQRRHIRRLSAADGDFHQRRLAAARARPDQQRQESGAVCALCAAAGNPSAGGRRLAAVVQAGRPRRARQRMEQLRRHACSGARRRRGRKRERVGAQTHRKAAPTAAQDRRDAGTAGAARGARAGPGPPRAAADARADRRHRLDVQSLRTGPVLGRRRDGIGRDLRRRGLDRGDPDRPARALRRRALRSQVTATPMLWSRARTSGPSSRSTTSDRCGPAASST